MGQLIRVLFAPDYRSDNPYQHLLAAALRQEKIETEFLSHYRRVFPLARSLAAIRPHILHLHWPEHYFKFGDSLIRSARRLRYPFDLSMATRERPLAVTAHNLKPHGKRVSLDPLIRFTLRRAQVIFAHSESAKIKMVELAGINPDKVSVVPHGDLADALPPLVSKLQAREKLGLSADQPVALVFGRVSPYKGIEELIEFWVQRRVAACLLIAGEPADRTYEIGLRQLAQAPSDKIQLRLHELSNGELIELLSAADCAVFNYSDILTSGSACLARSVGLPVLLPRRLETVDLAEPSLRVLRFERLDDGFIPELERAITIGPDFASAADWRAATGWREVARKTGKGYLAILGR